MSFKDQVAADMAIIFNAAEFGVAAAYTSFDGSISAKSIIVILNRSDDLAAINPGQAALSSIIGRVADISRPVPYDKIVINSATWTVETVTYSDDYTWTATATSAERPRI